MHKDVGLINRRIFVTINSRNSFRVKELGKRHHVHIHLGKMDSLRKIRDVMDKCQTQILLANLPKNLWGFVAMMTVHLINRLPSKTTGMRSPIEILEEIFPRMNLRSDWKPQDLGA